MSEKDQSGFTLVELLVTIVFMGVMIASIANIFISIQNVQKHATWHDQATRAAQRQVETLRSNSYTSLTAGQTIDFTSQLPTSLPGNRSGIVNVSAPSEDIRRIDVTVTYSSGGQTKTVKLTALIGAIGLIK